MSPQNKNIEIIREKFNTWIEAKNWRFHLLLAVSFFGAGLIVVLVTQFLADLLS